MVIDVSAANGSRKKEERLERLEAVVETGFRPSFERLLANPRVRDPINSAPFDILRRDAEALALYELIVKEDIKRAKHFFYIAELAKLREYSEYQKGAVGVMGEVLPSGFRVPLSGANHLYSTFASLRHPNEDLIRSDLRNRKALRARLQQEALIGNWAEVGLMCDQFESYKKDIVPFEYQCTAFYRSLCTGHTPEVEDALRDILDIRSVRKTNLHFGRTLPGLFMCLPGMWYAKLAWINGHQIEIKHPLVISELLPEEPLDSYDNPYDFLIDPILENKPLTMFGGATPLEEVETINRALYREKTE